MSVSPSTWTPAAGHSVQFVQILRVNGFDISPQVSSAAFVPVRPGQSQYNILLLLCISLNNKIFHISVNNKNSPVRKFLCREMEKNMCGDKRKDGSSKTSGTVITVTVLTLLRSGERVRVRSVFSLSQTHVPDSCECVE